MKRCFPKVEFPVICTESVGDRELKEWCHEVLNSMEWCKSPLMPFVILAVARRRQTGARPFPAESLDIPLLYEAFQDYTWINMPERLRINSQAGKNIWYFICHNYVSFREILETYNTCYQKAYKVAMDGKE